MPHRASSKQPASNSQQPSYETRYIDNRIPNLQQPPMIMPQNPGSQSPGGLAGGSKTSQNSHISMPRGPGSQGPAAGSDRPHTGSHQDSQGDSGPYRTKIYSRLYLMISTYPGGNEFSDYKSGDHEHHWAFVTTPLREDRGTLLSHFHDPKKSHDSPYASYDLSQMKNFEGIAALFHLGKVRDTQKFIEVLQGVNIRKGGSYNDGKTWYNHALVALEDENKKRVKEGRRKVMELPGWHHTLLTMGSKFGKSGGCVIM
jgi:hypothetical protein